MNEERKPEETIPVDEEKKAKATEETVESHELSVVTATPEPVAIASADLDDFLELIEKRNKAIERLTHLAIEKTTRHCWNDMGDYPYMNIAGAERMARVFMVKIEDMKCVKGWSEDEKGVRYYIYTYSARFSLPGIMDSTLEIGTCSQHDTFFGKRHIPKLDNQGVKIKDKDGKYEMEEVLLPMKDIDEGTIRKSAWTNCKIRGIRSLLGMQGITWEELEKVAKIRRADVKSVQFSKKRSGGGSYPATDPQKRKIWAMSNNAKCPMEKILERLGIKSMDEFMGNQMNPAMQFIEGWANADNSARSSEGKVSKAQAEEIRMMMSETDMTEDQFKKMFSNLPEDITPKQVEGAKKVLNRMMDERLNK